MGDLTEFFSRKEFDCRDGTEYPEAWILQRLRPLCIDLERIRAAAGGRSVKILSGFRTAAYNKKIGGAKNSTHMDGIAADFVIEGMEPRAVQDLVFDLRRSGVIVPGGIGRYTTFTHYDIRGTMANWTGGRMTI